jgi:acetyl esterase/lipase
MDTGSDLLSKLALPPSRPGRAPEAYHLDRRNANLGNIATLPLAAGVHQSEERRSGRACTLLTPSDPVGTIVFAHGGAYCAGGPGGRLVGVLSHVAAASGWRVLSISYGLAPENPFPAALHDAAAFVLDALEFGQPIVLAGESAGGGLMAALGARIAQRAPEIPLQALVLVSPWLDLTGTAGTIVSRAQTDRLFSPMRHRQAAADYLQGAPAEDPLASALFADLANVPPTQIWAGGDEILLDDAVGFARRLALAGRSVELHVSAGMQHVFPVLFPDLPASRRALGVMAQFIRTPPPRPNNQGDDRP